MFAVFDRPVARPPTEIDTSDEPLEVGLEETPGLGYDHASKHLREVRKLKYGKNSPEAKFSGPLAEECDWKEFYCGAVLSDKSTGAFKEGGAIGFSKAVPGITMAFAVQDSFPVANLPAVVTCCGKITNMDELCGLYGMEQKEYTSAEFLRDLYCKDFTDCYGDSSDQPSTALASMAGDWSFVLFDASSQYLLAGQSHSPAHPLAWGTEADDGSLMFGTELDIMTKCCSPANGGPVEMPHGCFFENDGFLHPTYEHGALFSFEHRLPSTREVKIVPRVDSKNHVKGLQFRSQSGKDLSVLSSK